MTDVADLGKYRKLLEQIAHLKADLDDARRQIRMMSLARDRQLLVERDLDAGPTATAEI
jgi:hypothetical protein